MARLLANAGTCSDGAARARPAIQGYLRSVSKDTCGAKSYCSLTQLLNQQRSHLRNVQRSSSSGAVRLKKIPKRESRHIPCKTLDQIPASEHFNHQQKPANGGISKDIQKIQQEVRTALSELSHGRRHGAGMEDFFMQAMCQTDVENGLRMQAAVELAKLLAQKEPGVRASWCTEIERQVEQDEGFLVASVDASLELAELLETHLDRACIADLIFQALEQDVLLGPRRVEHNYIMVDLASWHFRRRRYEQSERMHELALSGPFHFGDPRAKSSSMARRFRPPVEGAYKIFQAGLREVTQLDDKICHRHVPLGIAWTRCACSRNHRPPLQRCCRRIYQTNSECTSAAQAPSPESCRSDTNRQQPCDGGHDGVIGDIRTNHSNGPRMVSKEHMVDGMRRCLTPRRFRVKIVDYNSPKIGLETGEGCNVLKKDFQPPTKLGACVSECEVT